MSPDLNLTSEELEGQQAELLPTRTVMSIWALDPFSHRGGRGGNGRGGGGGGGASVGAGGGGGGGGG
jgi:hypothetical protein